MHREVLKYKTGKGMGKTGQWDKRNSWEREGGKKKRGWITKC